MFSAFKNILGSIFGSTEPSSSQASAPAPARALSQQTIQDESVLMMNPDGSIRYEPLFNLVAPPKTIVMWYQNNIPKGWVECNGQNNTPDLRNTFPFGWGISNTSRVPGTRGGEERVTLTINQMPAHSHNIDTYKYRVPHIDWDNTTSCALNWRTTETSSTGGSQPHENMPPFLVVKFIMKE